MQNCLEQEKKGSSIIYNIAYVNAGLNTEVGLTRTCNGDLWHYFLHYFHKKKKSPAQANN